MTPTLSILCVTRGEDFALRFLRMMASDAYHIGAKVVLGLDRVSGENREYIEGLRKFIGDVAVVELESTGIVESVLDQAVEFCQTDYILRLDDDERCSPAMIRWLKSGEWSKEPSWAFATAGLWQDEWTLLAMPELWPQYHTRLSRKEISGGRKRIHSPSPYGRGAIAPVVLEHHKFLVKSLAERQALAEHYDRIRPGAGKRCHSTPELVYDEFWLAPLGDGTFRTWAQSEVSRVANAREVTSA